MKSLIYSLLPMLMVLGLVSCQQDRGTLAEPENVAVAPVKVVVKSSLKATGSDATPTPTAALDREKKVNKLYAVAYRANGAFYDVFECTPEAGSTEVYTFDMKAEGAFQFHLVANADAELLNAIKEQSNVIGDIDRIVVKQTAGDDNQAANFVLTSDRVDVTTAKNSEATTTPSVVKLERLSARFDFLNRVPKLNITKITFKKRMTQSYLYARTDVSALASTSDKTYEATQGMEARQCVATIYGYENPVANDTYFTIEGTFNGKEIKPYEIRLDNLTVKRNHLYTIVINPDGSGVNPGDPSGDHTAGKLPLTIKVLDWEEGETLSKDDAELLVATYVDHSATVANAHFMDPFLTQSPSEIYTVTKAATTVELKVGTYIKPGTLVFDGAAPAGVTLEKKGDAVKEADGKYVQTYTLTLPEQAKYADVAQYFVMSKQSGREAEAAALPNFLDVKLIAKGPFGDEIESFVVRHGRMKTPLEHLSEYALKHEDNVYDQPSGFVESHNIPDQHYFKPVGLSKYFADNNMKWAFNGVNYHLPSDHYEWRSIFPENQQLVGTDALAKGHQFTHNYKDWAVHPRMRFFNDGTQVRPVLFKNVSDYGNDLAGKIGYALKFKGTEEEDEYSVSTDGSLLVAYRYEWVGTFGQKPGSKVVEGRESGKAIDNTCHLKVTARYLGKGWKGTIHDISKEEFWTKDNSQDVVRQFPYAGSYWKSVSPFTVNEGLNATFPCYTKERKTDGYFWNKAVYLKVHGIGASGSVLAQYEIILYPYYVFTDEL